MNMGCLIVKLSEIKNKECNGQSVVKGKDNQKLKYMYAVNERPVKTVHKISWMNFGEAMAFEI